MSERQRVKGWTGKAWGEGGKQGGMWRGREGGDEGWRRTYIWSEREKDGREWMEKKRW